MWLTTQLHLGSRIRTNGVIYLSPYMSYRADGENGTSSRFEISTCSSPRKKKSRLSHLDKSGLLQLSLYKPEQALRHMKVVTLSTVGTGRLYPPGDRHGTHFCYRLSRPQGHNAAGRIKIMKNPNNSIGKRTRGLPATIWYRA